MITSTHLDQWLNALGYAEASASLHKVDAQQSTRHPYAPELRDLLNPQGEIRAQAVFDVEGVPTVSFFLDDGTLLADEGKLAALRQRIWNQGLISVLLVLTPESAVPVPVPPKHEVGTPLWMAQARPDGPLSRADVQSGDIRHRYPDWFRVEDRVDRKLLTNLHTLIQRLGDDHAMGSHAYSRDDAQYLVGQTLFVSYLEHRRIVGDTYRHKHGVAPFRTLVEAADRRGLDRLLRRLKRTFNGDFLEREDSAASLWLGLPDAGFTLIKEFLAATDLERAQPSFFPYNFRYIPVELLSGIYESFVGKESKKKLAAYYTPRHLANLVVSQALDGVPDILAERIIDGACGSGILLTTAYRRILGEATARAGHGLSFRERSDLLKEHIYGSDLSDAAIRVTAFSLYLSLLDGLQPADIAALCDDENTKLPPLRGKNLFSGEQQGNFFSPDNPLRRHEFTLCLSNPPWMEPAGDEVASHEVSEENRTMPRPLRQLASDFAWEAEAYLAPRGRMCLILPMSLLLKPTSQAFVSTWLTHVIWRRVINFGDLKELLFDDGRFSCVVLLADRRPPSTAADRTSPIPPTETFEYWVPKADVGLAFGRLTLHTVDRHTVQTQAIAESNRELVTRMWGDDFDLALWAKLRLRGTFGDLVGGHGKRWRQRKGFHRTDNAVPRSQWVSSRPLWPMPFIEPGQLYDCPVTLATEARPFPRTLTHVPRLGDDLMRAFDGPRIVFPDGPAPDRTVRAAFIDGPASFMSSVGVILGPREDEDLLRFATIYLRSDLVRYFMVTQLYQLLSDRDRVSLRDIRQFPFYLPDRHPRPKQAWQIVRQIADMTRELEAIDPIQRAQKWMWIRPEIETRLERYFGLDDEAQKIIRETLEVLLPAARPYGMSRVLDLAQQRCTSDQVENYLITLRQELEAWRDARGGVGEFEVGAFMTLPTRAGPFGVVQVTLCRRDARQARITHEERAVMRVLDRLRESRMLPLALEDQLYFLPDTVIASDNTAYLIKPQQQRLWLSRQARRDAERIVETVTRQAAGPSRHAA